MNSQQKAILWVAAVVAAVLVFFPPWTQSLELSTGGISIKTEKPVSHSWIGCAPGHNGLAIVRIDYSRLLLELALLAGITALALVSEKKKISAGSPIVQRMPVLVVGTLGFLLLVQAFLCGQKADLAKNHSKEMSQLSDAELRASIGQRLPSQQNDLTKLSDAELDALEQQIKVQSAPSAKNLSKDSGAEIGALEQMVAQPPVLKKIDLSKMSTEELLALRQKIIKSGASDSSKMADAELEESVNSAKPDFSKMPLNELEALESVQRRAQSQ